MYRGDKISLFGLAFAGFFSFYQLSSVPWWIWLLLVIVLIILVYLIISGSGKKEAPAIEAPPAAKVEPEPEPEPVVITPDDLTKVEGIGPKINQFLQDAGIQTFAQLAEYDMEQLDKMLDEAKLRLADPTTWADQARLAAAGEWEALEKLQDELKGGRRA
jgi:predicted flap endonuclease-1-like 5' DNA nuclease